MNIALLWQLVIWIGTLGTALANLPVGQAMDIPVNIFITWNDGRRFVLESAKVRRIG